MNVSEVKRYNKNEFRKTKIIMHCITGGIFGFLFIIFLSSYIGSPDNQIHALGFMWDTETSKLRIFEAGMGFIFSFGLEIIEMFFRIRFPFLFNLLYQVFIFAAIVLGCIWQYWWIIPHFDTVTHGFAGMLLSICGYGMWESSLVNRIHESMPQQDIRIRPWVGNAFGISLSGAGSAVWEICEYIFDGYIWPGQNAQHHTTESGIPLQGHAALKDTMVDIFSHLIGGIVGVIVVTFFNIFGRNLPFDLQIKPAVIDKQQRVKGLCKKG